MNWYKTADKKQKIQKWLKQHPDDGVVAWTRSCDVFVSIGDWADRDIVDDLEHELGQDVEWDYETGSPGFDWVKVQ